MSRTPRIRKRRHDLMIIGGNKIAITIEAEVLAEVDELVRQRVFP